LSQVLQATIIQFAAEAHRRKMPYNAGSLYWQLDDCWPVASWSGIDYFGNWKALHYHARRFFAPVLVSIAEEHGAIRAYVVSDRREETAIRLLVRLVDFDGRELWRRESHERVPANSSAAYLTVGEAELFAGPMASERATEPAAGSVRRDRIVLVAEAFDGLHRLGRSLHYFARAKDLALDDPGLELEVIPGDDRHTVVQVRARKLARSVRVSANSAEGTFSDNYFDLLPGESVTLDWTGPRAKSYEVISVRDSY
jgi:beta-mannosidase